MKRWPLEALFAGSGGVAFPRMTALVGAGGKTTLMYALARRMADAGRRVVCTTTTKIFPPEDGLPMVLLEGAADPVAAVHDALSAAPCVVAAGRPLPDVRKLDGVSPRMLAVLSAALPELKIAVLADLHVLVRLAILVPAGAAVYAALIFIFNRKLFAEILHIVSHIRHK